eukprot:3524592-Pyramimonas_sp.AAC.1
MDISSWLEDSPWPTASPPGVSQNWNRPHPDAAASRRKGPSPSTPEERARPPATRGQWPETATAGPS